MHVNEVCCLTSLLTANIILDIPKILRKISRVSSQHRNKEKKFITIYVRQQISRYSLTACDI